MEKLLKKVHLGVVSQFNTIEALKDLALIIHLELQIYLTKHQPFFETFKGLPPSRGEYNNDIPLILGSQQPTLHPYRHPYS